MSSTRFLPNSRNRFFPKLKLKRFEAIRRRRRRSGRTVVDVIKLFFEEIWKIQISPQPKQQQQAILGAINSSRGQFCLNIAQFSHFCAGSDIRTNFIQFLNFGEIQISSKKNYNINYREDEIQPNPNFTFSQKIYQMI